MRNPTPQTCKMTYILLGSLGESFFQHCQPGIDKLHTPMKMAPMKQPRRWAKSGLVITGTGGSGKYHEAWVIPDSLCCWPSCWHAFVPETLCCRVIMKLGSDMGWESRSGWTGYDGLSRDDPLRFGNIWVSLWYCFCLSEMIASLVWQWLSSSLPYRKKATSVSIHSKSNQKWRLD